MFRKLGADNYVNVTIFLTLQEILQTKLTDWNLNVFSQNLLLWKVLLNRDFGIKNTKEIKNPHAEYKKIRQQLNIEQQFHDEILNAYIFSLMIKKNILSGIINDPEYPDESQNEGYQNSTHKNRMYELSVFESKDEFRQTFKKLAVKFSQVDRKELGSFIVDFKKDKNNLKTFYSAFLESKIIAEEKNYETIEMMYYMRIDACESLRQIMAKSKTNLNLNSMLQQACFFCSVKTAAMLIELGANVNYSQDNPENLPEFFRIFLNLPPLGTIICVCILEKHARPAFNLEPAKQIIQLLLSHGAETSKLQKYYDALKIQTIPAEIRELFDLIIAAEKYSPVALRKRCNC